MKEWKLRDKIGQMIMTGFPTADITPELIELIEEYKVANIILFSYNLCSVGQVQDTCMDLHLRIEQSTGHPAFIAVDQEGGVVTRLPKGACNVPGAMLIAAAGKEEYAYQAGVITGTQLKKLGINVNLAPVLDVNSNPDNPVIGVRSYSNDPYRVERYGINMMKGLLSEGVMPAVKHFPGHGNTAVDSHMGLPVVEKDLAELMDHELIPFLSAIKHGAPCVMTSHILFPKLEKEKKPATMSKAILTGLLREQLGFQGIIITDCLEMGAIQSFYGTAEGAVEAVKAGAELLCISHTPELVKEAIQKIEEAVAAGEIPVEYIDRAVSNLLKWKEKYRIEPARKDTSCIGSTEQKEAVAKMALAGITKVSPMELPEVTKDTVVIGSYAYRSTLASSSVDMELHFAKYMAEKFGCRYLELPVNPGEDEITAAMSQLKDASFVIYGLYNGHLNRGQIDLANKISREGKELLAVTLRNPYDFSLLDDKIHKLAAFEYNTVVFDALEKVIRKQHKASGKLPVTLK
ncbi:glycoside hydrolase family 3 protein [Anaerocolumna xylanovorans]|uniref:beta-N-acetylhexosaminidase n=1 Tax=Anaerocolumna xylanovorans DSM 12503 TaxID=1121345 RepID=A0A1M7XYB0_9FIRM|nr:glycoside hydrolase family 3 protein [Anaerocolumna xylanovorans]SHO43992.1 beta-N-acetylhexosaminidase [Anaerocolumna xylanovorans DSM 12503]